MALNQLVNAWRLIRVESALSRGRLIVAATVLSKVKSSGEQAHRAWRLRGRMMMISRRPLEGVACLTEALRHPGSTFGTLHELAFALTVVRDFDQAEAVLRGILVERTDDPKAATLLAHLYRAQGRFSSAHHLLKSLRPRAVAAKYADREQERPKLDWEPRAEWGAMLGELSQNTWLETDLVAAATDVDRRDALICLLDDLSKSPRGRRALVFAIHQTLAADAPWLVRYVRLAATHLRILFPELLASYLSRHGNAHDRHLLLAGLAEGGRTRHLSAVALINLGFTEYQEVIDEMRLNIHRSKVAAIPDDSEFDSMFLRYRRQL